VGSNVHFRDRGGEAASGAVSCNRDPVLQSHRVICVLSAASAAFLLPSFVTGSAAGADFSPGLAGFSQVFVGLSRVFVGLSRVYPWVSFAIYTPLVRAKLLNYMKTESEFLRFPQFFLF
jgi:hypothetical protein